MRDSITIGRGRVHTREQRRTAKWTTCSSSRGIRCRCVCVRIATKRTTTSKDTSTWCRGSSAATTTGRVSRPWPPKRRTASCVCAEVAKCACSRSWCALVFVLIAAEEALTCSEVAHGSGKERVAWVNFDLSANIPRNYTPLLRIDPLMMSASDCLFPLRTLFFTVNATLL